MLVSNFADFPAVSDDLNAIILQVEPAWTDYQAQANQLDAAISAMANEPEVAEVLAYSQRLQAIIQQQIDLYNSDVATQNLWRVPHDAQNIALITKTYLADVGKRFVDAQAAVTARTHAAPTVAAPTPLPMNMLTSSPLVDVTLANGTIVPHDASAYTMGPDAPVGVVGTAAVVPPPVVAVVPVSAPLPASVDANLLGQNEAGMMQASAAPASGNLTKILVLGVGAWLVSKAFGHHMQG
jgi:hypothetical protein